MKSTSVQKWFLLVFKYECFQVRSLAVFVFGISITSVDYRIITKVTSLNKLLLRLCLYRILVFLCYISLLIYYTVEPIVCLLHSYIKMILFDLINQRNTKLLLMSDPPPLGIGIVLLSYTPSYQNVLFSRCDHE